MCTGQARQTGKMANSGDVASIKQHVVVSVVTAALQVRSTETHHHLKLLCHRSELRARISCPIQFAKSGKSEAHF